MIKLRSNKNNILPLLLISFSFLLSVINTIDAEKSCKSPNNQTIDHNQKWFNYEDCSECHCSNGILTCTDSNNSESSGSNSNQNECENQPKSCLYADKIYLHNESWSFGNCTHCYCDNGLSRCQVQFCHSHISHINCEKEIAECAAQCPFGYEFSLSSDQLDCSQCSCKYRDLLDQLAFWISKNFTFQDLVSMQVFLQHHNAFNCNRERSLFTTLYTIIGILLTITIVLIIILYRERRKLVVGQCNLNANNDYGSPENSSCRGIDFFAVNNKYKHVPLYDKNFNMKSQQDFNLNLK